MEKNHDFLHFENIAGLKPADRLTPREISQVLEALVRPELEKIKRL